MSKVQWDVKFLPSGFDDKPENYRRALHPGSRSSALRYASEFDDKSNARVIKITYKPRPKVVAKPSFIDTVVCNPQDLVGFEGLETYKWMKERIGKRVRLTLEELGDE